jgi:hypothetical protein
VSAPPDPSALSPFQVEVGRLFFAQPQSEGFLLSGAAGLVAQQLTARPTHDLDLFTSVHGASVPAARDAFELAARARGWVVRRIRDSEQFCRLAVSSADSVVIVDLAVDSPPGRPATATVVGPTLAADDLVGRKVAALFSRAEARDFVDVFTLAGSYNRPRLLTLAVEQDAGFDRGVFAQMLRSLARFADAELPCEPQLATRVRTFFAGWADELETTQP